MPAPMADDDQPPLIAIDDRQTDAVDVGGERIQIATLPGALDLTDEALAATPGFLEPAS